MSTNAQQKLDALEFWNKHGLHDRSTVPRHWRRRQRLAFGCWRRTAAAPWKRKRGLSCTMPSGESQVPGTSRTSSVRISGQPTAWTWSCRRAGQGESHHPSIERVDQWSVHVSGNWRVVFHFEDSEAVDVIDYH